MQSAVEVGEPSTASVKTALNRGRIATVALFLSLAALWFLCCRFLSQEWRFNEQYSYGWFVPIFALYLFWLRWEDRPEQFRLSTFHFRLSAIVIAIAAVVLLPLRVFEIGNPDWRILGWIHAACVVAITLAIIASAGGKPWVRHFAFPVLFFLIGVPWPESIEQPIVQGLMRWAASLASDFVAALGIPAQAEGNVIRVSAGVVGINEACSGVRSLQTSFMIGLLFGELMRFRLWRRVALESATVLIALVANLGRSFLLVWIAATRGIPAMERVHDIAGYAILLVTFACAVACAKLLKESNSGAKKTIGVSVNASANNKSSPFGLGFIIAAFCWLIFIEVGGEAWYRAHERDLIAQPQWAVRWPTEAPGFHQLSIDERSRRLLRFDEAHGAAWHDRTAEKNSSLFSINLLYFFRWHPGQNNALLASVHRPEVCLPATGWKQISDFGVQSYLTSDGLRLPFRHFEFTHPAPVGGREQFAHAFYCFWEDRTTAARGEIVGAPSEWTLKERLRVVMEGRRHLGQQVLEFVTSNEERMPASDAEKHFAVEVKKLIEVPSSITTAAR